jgi:ArsR family transcriptional regulator
MAEVDRIVSGYFNERDSLEAISRQELLRRIKEGLVTVPDVRLSEECASWHLPGAVNLPVKELKKRFGELPKRQEIIAYCRGLYCVFAFEAVAALRKKGVQGKAFGGRLSGVEGGGSTSGRSCGRGVISRHRYTA